MNTNLVESLVLMINQPSYLISRREQAYRVADYSTETKAGHCLLTGTDAALLQTSQLTLTRRNEINNIK